MRLYNYFLLLFIKIQLFLTPKPVIVKEEVMVKDPSGFMKHDIQFIKQHLGNHRYKVGDSLEQVAFNAGQASVVQFIETKLMERKRHGIR